MNISIVAARNCRYYAEMYPFKTPPIKQVLIVVGLAPLFWAAASQRHQGSTSSRDASSECQLEAVHAVVQLANANPALRAAAFPQHPGFGVSGYLQLNTLLVSVNDLSGERSGQMLFQVSLDAQCHPLSIAPLTQHILKSS